MNLIRLLRPLLSAALILPAILIAGEAENIRVPPDKLRFDSPVPFFHDYNLSVLHPVGEPGGRGEDTGQGREKRLRLDDCVMLALENSPDHNISRQALMASFGDIMAAWGNLVPTMWINWGINQSRTSFPLAGGERRSRLSNAAYGNLGLSFTLFNSGIKYFGLRNAYYLRNSMRNRLEGSALEVVDQVHQDYFDVLRQEHLLNAAREQAVQLEEQLRRARRRHEVGEVTRLDVLQARIDLQNQELLILQYENDLVTARMDLEVTVGGGLGEGYELEDGFEIHEPRFEVDSLVAEAIESHPDVQSARLDLKQRRNDLIMGRLAYLPSFKTQFGYSRNESDLVLLPEYQRGRQLSFSLNWDILDAFARYRTNRYNEADANTARYELRKLELTVSRDVRAGYLELLRLYQQHLTLEQSMRLARESLTLEQRRYELGSTSMVELRQARADFVQAEADYINSVYDFHQALSALSRSVGSDISDRYYK